MPTPNKPPIVKLSDLKDGERGTFFVHLVERTKSMTREQLPFYTCRFRDLKRTATFLAWLDSRFFPSCESTWQPGQFFKIHGLYADHPRFGPQIDIERIRVVEARDAEDGFKADDFAEHSRIDVDAAFGELYDIIKSTIIDEPLRKLTLGLLTEHANALKELPAHPRTYYPYAGGWLEHVLNVLKNCLWLTDRYRERYGNLKPPLNKDLIAAGAALHEIGRVRELTVPSDSLQTFEHTIDGHFAGYVILGRDLVRDAIRAQGDIDPQLSQMLEHLMLSFLRRPGYRSIRLPLIPEILIIHYADELDAKMEMYTRCLIKDVSPGPFTERDPMLGKPLFKGRSV